MADKPKKPMPGMKGYRGSNTLKKTNTPINWTPELLQEYVEASKSPIAFAEKHMKIVNVDKGLMTISLYDYQKQIIQTALDNRFTIAECARQSGKALPLDTPIPTPNGWTTMGALKTGDELFDENGQVTKVRSVSKIFENHDCFKLIFDDGTEVKADAEHLWAVERASASVRAIKHKKLTTRQLFESGYVYHDSRGKAISKWKIKTAGPAQYRTAEVPVDPYVLGLWLGDGSAADGRLTAAHEDQEFYVENITYEFSHNHTKRDLYTGTLYGLSSQLRTLDVLNNKHIPTSYLMNSIEVRKALLQGLMDSDGTVEKSGRLCLALSYTSYPKLIEGAYELLVSLGFKVFRKEYPKTNSCRLYFQCPREVMDVFRLPRKLTLQPKVQERPEYTTYRYIRKIEKIESVPTRCIEVWNDSHLFLCSKHFIPTHNTTAITVLVLWYVLFNANKTVAILANKAETAREILGKIKLAYEHLPKWLQQGVEEWNKGSVSFENGSRILAGATSSSNIRGYAINLLLIDEAAFIEGWDEFFTSVFPTISSGKTTKVILVSTVNGLNHFYQLTSLARKKKNSYKLISVTWRDVPGRDEHWHQQMLASMNFDEERFAQEFENRYLGSGNSLIAGWKLAELGQGEIPIAAADGFKMYVRPEKDHQYVVIADVSRGKGLDYSTAQVIDVTTSPYEQVMTFRSNQLTPGDFAEVLNRIGREYREAPIMVEINDIGGQVADTLFDVYEYPAVLMTEGAGAMKKKITYSWTYGKTDRGIRTTLPIKQNGCSMLKLLVEGDILKIRDYDTIFELSTFSKDGDGSRATYAATEGHHDDMVMPLVLFGWMTNTDWFRSMTDIDTIVKLKEQNAEAIAQSLTPFGFVDLGPVHTEPETFEEDGDLWTVAPEYRDMGFYK